jgi:hypothetical protein
MTEFRADVYQNEFLPEGSTDVNAIVTVAASGAGGAAARVAAGTNAVEVIVIDCSGSMEGIKLREAKRATATAIDAIDDGVQFAVVAGSDGATILYPRSGTPAVSSAATREEAKESVRFLEARGGTHIGVWLSLARRLFEQVPGAVAHAILLTDGRIEGETIQHFEQELARCTGLFQCDCRGVGTDWEVNELRKIAQTLLGSVDIVAKPENLAADFEALMGAAMSKAVANVALRIWAPQGAQLLFVKQVAPSLDDLTAKAMSVNPLTTDFPLGSWGNESRDYHVCIRVVPGAVGSEKLAARASLVVDDQVVSQGLVRAVWTDDSALSTKINPQVAHYTGQAELAAAIQDGLEARKSGDVEQATKKLGRAVQLAAESGNDATMKLLAKVVDVESPERGTVRLKRQVDLADEMALDTRSTKTVRTRKVGEP